MSKRTAARNERAAEKKTEERVKKLLGEYLAEIEEETGSRSFLLIEFPSIGASEPANVHLQNLATFQISAALAVVKTISEHNAAGWYRQITTEAQERARISKIAVPGRP